MVDGKEISMTRVYGKKISHEALMEEILRDRVFFMESGGGVTFSGGEPLMQSGALIKLLKDSGKEGLHRAVDTSGYAEKDTLLNAAQHTDLFLYDLKLMNPARHKEYTGVDNRQILDNADKLLHAGAKIIFRIPVIPGVNDSADDINAFLDFFEQRQGKFREVHLLPYHKTGTEKYRRLEKEYAFREPGGTEEDQLQQFRKALDQLGIIVLTGG
jgi:pyruvate formate lyase activating enzyme